MSASGNKKVVVAALLGNLGIAAAKFLAAALTGSVAVLAEGVHSVADTGNQALLLLGMRLAKRPATKKHPFGRAGELYFWPFIVAVMLFTVGAVAALYEGSHRLLHLGEAAHSVHGAIWNYAVLGVSIVLESLSFWVAYREFRKMARGRSVMRVIRDARDPTVVVVLLEDSAALAGLVLALVGVMLTAVTRSPVWDGAASLAIGGILAVVACILAYETHSLIIGESATPDDEVRAREIIGKFEWVEGITELLTMHIGPQDVILAVKVAFPKDMDIERVEGAINEIEREVRAQLPHMTKIFVEPDSRGDATLAGKTEAA